jgi:hypothetical protein
MSHHDFLCVTLMGKCKPADTRYYVVCSLFPATAARNLSLERIATERDLLAATSAKPQKKRLREDDRIDVDVNGNDKR